ncbi:Sec-independent protein translocase protein TatB [Enterobacteriaceae bacterium LUAb1]
MFEIGFSELILVFVIGLVVLGPQRLPVAVKTVVGWIRAMRSLASSVQHELAQELKLQELQDSLRKVEQAGKDALSPELSASMDELKQVVSELKHGYHERSVSAEVAHVHPDNIPPEQEENAPISPVSPSAAVSKAVTGQPADLTEQTRVDRIITDEMSADVKSASVTHTSDKT